MTGVLFWNACITSGQKPSDRTARIEDALAELAAEQGADILFLAEYGISTEGLTEKLSRSGRTYTERPANTKAARVRVLADSRLDSEVLRDSRYYVIHEFKTDKTRFLAGGVHLPSKLHAGERDAEIAGAKLNQAVREAEAEAGHEKILLAGDFNANPFEHLMAGFGCLHAIGDAESVAEKKARTVYEEKRPLFYNPMWNCLGDSGTPKGSYYSDSGEEYRIYWNVFDQFVMSAPFVKAYRRDSLKILSGTAGRGFLYKNGRPDKKNYSDHLPVFLSFQEELL